MDKKNEILYSQEYTCTCIYYVCVHVYYFQRSLSPCHPLLLTRVQHGAAFVTDDTAEISGWRIIRVMVKNIWPKEQPALKARVLAAVGLLVGSKVRCRGVDEDSSAKVYANI